jgi:hypothetical protein
VKRFCHCSAESGAIKKYAGWQRVISGSMLCRNAPDMCQLHTPVGAVLYNIILDLWRVGDGAIVKFLCLDSASNLLCAVRNKFK